MYYQQNPIFTVMIVIIGLGAYLFLKSRGKKNGNNRFGFLSGRPSQYSEGSDTLLTFVMFQQFLDSDSHENQIQVNTENSQRIKEIEKIKEEVLDLLSDG